jgi:hypothetical protein
LEGIMRRPEPTIHHFAFDAPVIRIGSPNAVTWEVRHAARLTLSFNGEQHDCTNLRSWQFPDGQVTECELFAHGSSEEAPGVSAKALCTVLGPVSIRSFTQEPISIMAGTPVQLRWETKGADAVLLLPDGISLPPTGTKAMFPQDSKEYVLRASNAFYSEESQPCFVYVQPMPQIGPLVLPLMPALNGVADKLADFLQKESAFLSYDGDAPLEQVLLWLNDSPFLESADDHDHL